MDQLRELLQRVKGLEKLVRAQGWVMQSDYTWMTEFDMAKARARGELKS
jgi:hypothetical protein